MNIEEKLKEVGKYFKDKVIAGDYEFLECTEYVAKIRIDGKYKFMLWIANEIKIMLNFYTYSDKENDLFKEMTFETQAERIAAWKKLKPFVIEYKQNQLKAENLNRIQQLQNELNKLS